MKVNTHLNSIINTYHKMSNIGKVLFFISIFIILISFFNYLKQYKVKEGFTQTEQIIAKTNNEIYDDFYASIYDYLVENSVKTEFEIGTIDSLIVGDKSVILDVGCGTGDHVGKLVSKNLDIIGIDISPAMIKQANLKYPNAQFIVGNAMDRSEFQPTYFTHILCLYFTIYYFKDKRQFFNNCMYWLMPGGYFVLHLVDREKFDPILPPGNPLYIVSPQKYAKSRITKTKITFNEFTYNANFDLNKDVAVFNEKFDFNDGKKRTHEQKLYMEDTQDILTMAQQSGFTLHSIIDMIKCGYEYQYLYVFVKP